MDSFATRYGGDPGQSRAGPMLAMRHAGALRASKVVLAPQEDRTCRNVVGSSSDVAGNRTISRLPSSEGMNRR